MSLTSKDLADVFGQSQVISSNWAVNGELVFTKNGNTLTISPVTGITLKNIRGEITFSLNMEGIVDGKIIDLINSSVITGAVNSQGSFIETFETSGFGWTITEGVPQFKIGGIWGGKYLRGAPNVLAIYDHNIPYDETKLYTVSCKLAVTNFTDPTPESNCEVGLIGIAADGVTKLSRTGVNTFSDAHPFIQKGLVTSTTPVSYTGYVSGTTNSPASSPSTNPASPNGMYTGTKYIRPYIWLNLDLATSESTDCDDVSITWV